MDEVIKLFDVVVHTQDLDGKVGYRYDINLELKNKFKGYNFEDETESVMPVFAAGSNYEEARDALEVLGYPRQQAEAVLSRIDTSSMSVEEIIRQSLKELMK